MTETMPAFGADRNEKISKLLGWKMSTARYWHNPNKLYGCPELLPDYCGDDAACFGLMVTLQNLPFVRFATLYNTGEASCVKIGTDLLNYPDGWTYDACEQSELPGAAGCRDAITQAAWEALTAAKESK